MSVEYSAIIVVGFEYDEIYKQYEDWVKLHSEDYPDHCFYDFVEYHDMEIVPPYYDASYEDSLIGKVIKSSGDYGYNVINEIDFKEKVIQAQFELGNLFKIMPEVYLTTRGY